MARILIIEDNPANRELMVYLLNAFHHTTIEATDGVVGLEMAISQLPDLILCDLQLPEMDGYMLAHEIKNIFQAEKIPLIAVTAFAMPGDREKALAAGFDGYIPKPINPETFVEEIEQYLKEAT